MSEETNIADPSAPLRCAQDDRLVMPTAIAEADRLYRTQLPNRDFMIDLMLFLRNGIVVSYPDLFVMARPIRSDATPIEVADLARPMEDPDAWFAWLVVTAGEHRPAADATLKRLAALVPYYLPWICFYRKFDEFNVLKRYATDRFMGKIIGQRPMPQQKRLQHA